MASKKFPLSHLPADNGRNLSNMERADHLQSNFETVPAAQFRIAKGETTVTQTKFIIQKPIKLQPTASVQKSLSADIQKILRFNSAMDNSSVLADGTHPTWIIRRHLTQNDSATDSAESKSEIAKPIKIENWTTANAKRVEANRKLLQQQIPYKSSTASVAFKETIEEYERIIGMHRKEHQNITSNGGNTTWKHGTSSNGTSHNKIFEKSMSTIEEQHGHAELKTILRYLKHGRSEESIERTAPMSKSHGQYNDHIQNEPATNEKAELDNHRSNAIRKEQEDMPQESSYQTAIVLNVFEGKPTSVSSSNNNETISSKTVANNKRDIDEKVISKSANFKSGKAIQSDLLKDIFQNVLPSYQRDIEQQLNSASEVTVKQIFVQGTIENSKTEKLTLKKTYSTGCSSPNDKSDNVKQQVCDIKINEIADPSTTTFSYNNGQINQRMDGNEKDCQKKSIIDENEKNNPANNVTSKFPFHSKQPMHLEIFGKCLNAAFNAKQTPIRTSLSRKKEEDEYDVFEEEHEPDWVTSSFRLGSIRRKKNEKNVAMQRIQKEIELEKQRHHEMIKMRRNDKLSQMAMLFLRRRSTVTDIHLLSARAIIITCSIRPPPLFQVPSL
ncbi:hypothetical protein ACH3XW_8095 [Acanthocheilonema viteae]